MSAVEYKRFRNYVTNRVRVAKTDYYHNKLDSYRGDLRRTWRIVNDVLKPNKKTVTLNSVSADGIEYSTSEEIAKQLNSYFSTVGQSISESITDDQSLSFLNFMRGNFVNSFFFSPITIDKVKSTIMSFSNKSCNIDELPILVLKKISPLISPILTELFNKSICLGHFPDSYKIARIIPIPKVSSAKEINQFRPISILPIFSKIFEKIVYLQLYNYCENSSVFDRYQYGFRRNRNTAGAILRLLQDVYNDLESNDYSISIFLDFAKAFVCVNHNVLLSKLSFYGIRGIANRWFSSYLSSRRQYVFVNNHCSSTLPVGTVIPQGSNLSSLLFLIFINDLPNSSNFFRFTLFADDSTLNCPVQKNNIVGTAQRINAELAKVTNWLSANKIKINVDKTKYVLFSIRECAAFPDLKMCNESIGRVDHVRFLGVLIDQHLTFEKHVDMLSVNLSRCIGIFSKLNQFIPVYIMKTLYFSLFHSLLNYCTEAWCGTSQFQLNRIKILQKKAIRCINRLPYLAHTTPFFISMNIMTFDQICKFKSILYMYKTINLNHDNHLLNLVILNNPTHNHSTRLQFNFTLPLYRKSKSQCSFLYRAIKYYISLPDDLRSCGTLYSFKKKLRQYVSSAQR